MKRYKIKVNIYTYKSEVKKAIKELSHASNIIGNLYECYQNVDLHTIRGLYDSEETKKIKQLLDHTTEVYNYFLEKDKDNKIL